MRVNISYSIELEDVPTVIAEMIEEVCNELQHTAADKLIDAAANLKTNDEVELSRVGVSLQQISKIRALLASLDTRLQDCDNMLKGYVNTMQQLAIGAASENLAEIHESVSEITGDAEEASNEEEVE